VIELDLFQFFNKLTSERKPSSPKTDVICEVWGGKKGCQKKGYTAHGLLRPAQDIGVSSPSA
jgi:hypothetical protein